MAVSSLSAVALLLIIARATGAYHENESASCGADGLHVDYESGCREYYRCAGGAVTARYSCPEQRAFSPAESACVPAARQPCVRRACGARDKRAYAAPGTTCRHYYRCNNGTAHEFACPAGAWFDLETQACSRGAGTCFEPVCAGLRDGDYPDPSHECRRRIRCAGGQLRALLPCDASCATPCPPPRRAAAARPAGDAAFCPDASCGSLCAAAPAGEGTYADRAARCREYFVCAGGRVVRRGVCEPGALFAGGACRAAALAACPAPAPSPCLRVPDGLHRHWRDCSSWLECRRERVVARGACPAGEVFDGSGCVPAARFWCMVEEDSPECAVRPAGLYPDASSNCTRYYHCAGARRTWLACGAGRVFDGARCTAARAGLCAAGCAGRAEGRHAAREGAGGGGAGCRGYYECARGERTDYACAPGEMFEGDACVPARPGACTEDSCSGFADGYHPDLESNCRRYFYCDGGDRLVTLTCPGGNIFDGRSCVNPSEHQCGDPPVGSIESEPKNCKSDGFFLEKGTDCRDYYFCLAGEKTHLKCPEEQAFNGQLCVSRARYTCPG